MCAIRKDLHLQIVAIGELLWDVFGETELLGGAPLNFSAAAQRLGNSVTLVSGVGQDARGSRAIQSMTALGLTTDFVQVVPGRQTGTAIVSTDNCGNASYSFRRPAAFDDLVLSSIQLSQLRSLRPEWMYFGTLAQTNEANEGLLHRLIQQLPDIRCFYDINLRDGHWNLSLVQRLSRLASVVKLNEDEAEMLFRRTRTSETFSLEEFCRYWSSAHLIDIICITRGSEGCAIFKGDALCFFEGFAVDVVDTVGAGDAFAAAFLHGLILDWPIARKASFANALGALVASRPGATPVWNADECLRLISGPRGCYEL